MLAYWLANFTMDYAKYLVFGFIAPILIIIVDVEVLISDGNIEFFWALCLLYGLAIITFAYFLSFFFNDPSNGQIMVFLLAFLGGKRLSSFAIIICSRIDSADGAAGTVHHRLNT